MYLRLQKLQLRIKILLVKDAVFLLFLQVVFKNL